MPRITAIMNAYGRPEQFMAQKNAILRQSIRPKEIMVWQNSHKLSAEFKPAWFGGTTRAQSNYNLGVWPRFAYALNARTEYICIFDDDTIPGRNWFQNCINTLKTHDGLLGTAGVIFKTDQAYKPFNMLAGDDPMTNRLELISWVTPGSFEGMAEHVLVGTSSCRFSCDRWRRHALQLRAAEAWNQYLLPSPHR